MATLSTAAWIGHDLAVAADFGGALFGQLALDPAIKRIRSLDERGEVLDTAWSTYHWMTLASAAIMGSTWLAGRRFLSGWEVGPASRGLVVAKDWLVGTAVVSGIASVVVGSMIGGGRGKGTPTIGQGMPAPQAPKRDQILQRAIQPIGIVHLAAVGGVMAVTTILAMKSGKSSLWSIVSRFLP